MKNLIIYYSRKGENYWSGSIKNLEKGNTERIAEFIKNAVGGDLFEIRTVKTYAADYNSCIEEAKQELQNNARPELVEYLDDVSEYDNVFIGYPNWWGTCPMAVFSLLERLNLAGKKILPFCTNEGSGMGSSEKDLMKIVSDASFVKGLPIRGTKASESESVAASWARKNI